MKKLIPVILCCAMLLAACGSSADSAPAASESTSAAASSEAASSEETTIGGADGETDIAVSDEANTANLDAADFFHLQFWHVNLCGPGSALPVPRLEILFE